MALATPTAERGPIDPVTVDALDISVVAALLGIDRMAQAMDDDWHRMRRERIEAAQEGRPAPTWEQVK